MEKKKPVKKKMESQHKHFLVVMVLFSAFSMYAITSFFSSTEKYIDGMYASVAGDGTVVAEVDIPLDCQTCPNTPVCDPVCTGNSAEPYTIFIDVDSNYVYADAIEALYLQGIINGYEDGSFKPDNTINRAELLTILTNAVDADLSGDYSNCFTDVKTDWYAPFVCYAKAQGWVNGYQDGSYRPAQTVVRAEVLKIILEAFNYEIPASVTVNPLADVKTTDWYAPYVQVAIENGIVVGFGNFDAAKQVTRGEFVDMVYKAM